MRIAQPIENGNVFEPHDTNESFNSSGWLNIETNSRENSNNSQLNSNCNVIYGSGETTESFVNYTTAIENLDLKLNVEFTVCNRQYRINAQKISSNLSDLEEGKDAQFGKFQERANEESDVFSDETPIDDDRVFEHSDTDEMSERGIHLVPRGIVNPNYPGFQHLAHTLQDYSSNIENFYHSENDMTDDDADIEITELAYEPDDNQIETVLIECQNNNNNNTKKERSQNNFHLETKTLDSNNQNDMPDLLKTLSKHNNNNDVDLFSYELNCSDADIENNFHTKDIIGDFNKEVEEEIKQLLNYNINIQDDLEELRKDIKDTLAKPIENTINNISDVVNHVIKKLVETKSDSIEDVEDTIVPDTILHTKPSNEDEIAINKENEKNSLKEMHLSRPTFLHIDNYTKIDDAFLSDGKDEIDISKYEPDQLSQNVENTIKQLSTELRKIIPKLDEMRQRDKLWAECKRDAVQIVTDGNSNEIRSPSNSNGFITGDAQESGTSKSIRHNNTHVAQATVRNIPLKSQKDSGMSIERQNDEAPGDELSSKDCCHNAHSNTSVLKNDSGKDFDLGSFDVYNIETALPKLDILDAIENHLRAAKEAERRMLESLVSNIKRKFSKTSEENRENIVKIEKPGAKRGLHLFKFKLSKINIEVPPVNYSDDTALSPRAVSTADSAHTDIEWPDLVDKNPNILDKFTRIVTITDHAAHDKKKRNDREEIRKRLAMGAEAEEYYSLGYTDRPGKKPSLHSRLQSGMNLQICFMNETASDNESQASEMDGNINCNKKSLSRSSLYSKNSYNHNHPYQTRPLSVNITKHDKISTVQSGAKLRPTSLTLKTTKSRSSQSLNHIELKESDFFALQSTLQTEARMALAQAKEMARIQMERERHSRAVSPVTEMLRRSMQKANAPLAADRRRVSRQLLTDMNIAQLQVIVNELHSEIEQLNDNLVTMLMARDELHMGQDSMLVDIEDLTRYLGVKEQTKKTKGTTKTGMKRLTSLVQK